MQVCVQCKESGATLCCSTHSCKKYYHYHCASVVGKLMLSAKEDFIIAHFQIVTSIKRNF